MGGLTNIEWDNRIAEISLILGPKYRKKGKGKEAAELVLKEGFNRIGLKTVYGECYKCNPSVGFWEHLIEKYKGYKTILPNRKFFEGFHDSIYFSFDCSLFTA